jgi:hypothetical protein
MTDRAPKKRPGWETVCCIASGPSLNAEQLEHVRKAQQAGRVKVIGVNTTYQAAPWLDALFACDSQWWRAYQHDGAHGQGWRSWRKEHPNAETVTQDASTYKQFGLDTRQRGSARDGLGIGELHTGSNGGHAAVNLAFLWGARRIILLGYCMKLGPNGEKHFHGDHPKPCVQSQLFSQWVRRFESTAKDLKKLGIDVVNCTPASALPWFRSGLIGTELEASNDTTAE